MSQLGPVGISLSVGFALFMTVLFFELCYVWWSRQRRLREAGEARSTNVQSVEMAMKRAHWKWSTWSKIVRACCSLHEADEPKSCVKLLCWLSPTDAKMACSDAVEEGGKVGQKQQGEEEVEEEEEEDVLGLGGLWAPARLLFTIKEETKEEMELEEVRCNTGSVIRHASSEQLLFVASSCTSPFVTPPSSPPFATPFGSPAAPALPFNNTLLAVEVDSSSSSTSSSSPLLGRRPLSVLFEDTSSSSFSPSSVASSAATPAALSPSGPPPCSSSNSTSPNKRHPLCLLLDPPPSPSSALYHYHNRVHPVTLGRCNVSGKPKSSPSFPLTKPEPPLPFHIPAPSQPTTPCPFRPSLHVKIVASSPPVTTMLPRLSSK